MSAILKMFLGIQDTEDTSFFQLCSDEPAFKAKRAKETAAERKNSRSIDELAFKALTTKKEGCPKEVKQKS